MSHSSTASSMDVELRPGNPAVPVRTPDSPFVLYQRFGLNADLGSVCEAPKAEVITNLLAGWERTHGS